MAHDQARVTAPRVAAGALNTRAVENIYLVLILVQKHALS